MRLLSALSLVALLVVVAGCAPAATPAPTAAAPQVKANLNQVMRGILFPNSNIIFDSQDTDPGAPPDPAAGGSSPYSGTYGGWEAVENAAMALGEADGITPRPTLRRGCFKAVIRRGKICCPALIFSLRLGPRDP